MAAAIGNQFRENIPQAGGSIQWVSDLKLELERKRDASQIRANVPFPIDLIDKVFYSCVLNLAPIYGKKNILIANVQFLVRTGSGIARQYECRDGGFLYFGKQGNGECSKVTVLIANRAPGINKTQEILGNSNSALL